MAIKHYNIVILTHLFIDGHLTRLVAAPGLHGPAGHCVNAVHKHKNLVCVCVCACAHVVV